MKEDVFEKTSRGNLTMDDIYKTLRQEILTLKLLPGQTLSENQMSARFQTSRTPIRNVFARLGRDGLIIIQPQKGSIISTIDLDLASQIIYMRAQVECGVITQVSTNRNPLLLQRLQNNLHEQERAVNDGVAYMDYYKLDSQFHELNMSECKKQKLWQLIQNLDVHYSRYRLLDYQSMIDNNVVKNLTAEHTQLFEYISSGETSRIPYAVFSHLYGGFLRMGTKMQKEYASFFTKNGRGVDEILVDIKVLLNEKKRLII